MAASHHVRQDPLSLVFCSHGTTSFLQGTRVGDLVFGTFGDSCDRPSSCNQVQVQNTSCCGFTAVCENHGMDPTQASTFQEGPRPFTITKHDHRGVVMALVVTFILYAVMIIGMRLAARLRTMGVDDYLAILATVCGGLM